MVVQETINNDEKEMAALDAVMMRAGNDHAQKIIKATCPDGLAKPFPHNNLQARGPVCLCMHRPAPADPLPLSPHF